MTPMELRRIGQNRGQWGRAKFRSQKTQPESGYQMRAGRLEGVAEAVGLVRSLPPSWRYRRLGPGMQLWWGGPWALTVIVVGDHVAVLVVGEQRGWQGLQRWWLCGGGRQGWARAPSPNTPTPSLPTSYRSSLLGPQSPAQAAQPSPQGAQARASLAFSCSGEAWAASGGGCIRLGQRVGSEPGQGQGRWGLRVDYRKPGPGVGI